MRAVGLDEAELDAQCALSVLLEAELEVGLVLPKSVSVGTEVGLSGRPNWTSVS